MDEKAKRRWFRFAFSLRTLFVVVTIFGVCLGWQSSIVRERKALIAEMDALTTGGNARISLEFNEQMDAEYARVPSSRRWFGDESYIQMRIPIEASRELVSRVEQAFPESQLNVFEGPRDPSQQWRDSLYKPASSRQPNIGTLFTTGLIEK